MNEREWRGEEAFNWTCPFCEQPVTITKEKVIPDKIILSIDNSKGHRILFVRFIVCPNPKCKEFTLEAKLFEVALVAHLGWVTGKEIKTWQLVPESKVKSFPKYIPKAILQDYKEACLIKNLSPKASAALARRCLQGIVRDFWKVKPGKLAYEIEQIQDKVELLTWEAIDAVRSVGNIGAHMEEDVNLIVDIEPNETELLINLIETLLKDWYIASHEKTSRLEELVKLGADKEVARKKKKPV